MKRQANHFRWLPALLASFGLLAWRVAATNVYEEPPWGQGCTPGGSYSYYWCFAEGVCTNSATFSPQSVSICVGSSADLPTLSGAAYSPGAYIGYHWNYWDCNIDNWDYLSTQYVAYTATYRWSQNFYPYAPVTSLPTFTDCGSFGYVARVMGVAGPPPQPCIPGGACASTYWNTIGTFVVNVVDIASLTPSEGEWVNDGDGNPNTDTYLVRVDCPLYSHWIAVTAVPDPALDEVDLPSCWGMNGGTVAPGSSGKLTRYVHTGTVGTTVVTVTAGSSSRTVTMIVYRAEFGLRADEGNRSVFQSGHSWWKFSLTPEDAKAHIYPASLRHWIDDAGYWPLYPVGPPSYCQPGNVTLGDQNNHPATGQHDWEITFWALRSGLQTVQDLNASPGTFCLFLNNCTTKAIEISDPYSPPVPNWSGIIAPWDLSDVLKNEPWNLCQ